MEAESKPPLCVDLDGTLVRSDTLMEALIALVRSNPTYLALCPFWLLRGRAHLKRKIAERVTLDVAHLPYSAALLDLLARERAAGRTLVLVTAADRQTAQPIADHLGIFHEVLASDAARVPLLQLLRLLRLVRNAKAYQVKQVRVVIVKYRLAGGINGQ